VISLRINGELRQYSSDITVATLIEQMKLAGKRVAIELNGKIVPRSAFPSQRLFEGDRLEVVVAVGGG
jgi:sulfur carrier protein